MNWPWLNVKTFNIRQGATELVLSRYVHLLNEDFLGLFFIILIVFMERLDI